MDFGLTDDQAAVQDLVRKVARSEIAPGYLGRAQADAFPWEIHQQLGRLGVLGLLAGAEYSQLDRDDYVAAGLAVEELAYADFNVANAVIPVLLVTSLISRHGTAAMRAHWLPPLASGTAYAAFGLTEAGSGSDAAALRTEAVADADGYLISGEKTSVTRLAHAQAMIVTARTRRDGARPVCQHSW